MKLLILGSKGQLGSELQDILKSGMADLGEISDVQLLPMLINVK